MINETYAYPFDPTGTRASNKIQGERQALSAPNWSDAFFVVPLVAPYFRHSLRVVHHPSGKVLSEGADYECTHRFHSASLATAKPVYGSITFYDKTLQGMIELEYQTIGGAWTINEATVQEILSDKLLNPRRTTWEQVVELPFQFPVIDHEWDLVDMVGASALETALEGIKDAIIASGEGGLGSHLADFNNPHRVTAAQIGLGNVPNVGFANLSEATDGTTNERLMSPLRTFQAINVHAIQPLAAHTANYDNPHQVTAAQVQLGNVPNYGPAGKDEAEAGLVNNKLMTPLRTADAIQVKAVAPLQAFIARRDNPHQVTAAQVGLGLTPNSPYATLEEARAGTATDRLMSPALVREAVVTQSGNQAVEHINNYNNPHNVDKTQVGLGNVPNYGVATNGQAVAGEINTALMTPLRTAEAITVFAVNPLTNHINNTLNPHQVTASQVGLGNVPNLPKATDAQASAGQSDLVLMTPRGVALAIAALSDPDGQGQSIAAHLADKANPHEVTAAQVGAYTATEVDELLLGKLGTTAEAANAARVGGFTPAELVAQVQLTTRLNRVRAYTDDDVTVNGGVTWNQLGVVVLPEEADYNPPADLTFFAVGGERNGSTTSPVYLVNFSLRDPDRIQVQQLSGEPDQLTFGYTYDDVLRQLVWYVKNPVERNELAFLVVTNPNSVFQPQGTALDVEPEDIIYVTQQINSAAAHAEPGEVELGRTVGQDGPSTGHIIESINVLHADDDDLDDAPTYVNALRDDWHNFHPASAFGSVNRDASLLDLHGWRWDNGATPDDGALYFDDASDTLASLRSNRASENYSFEVELSADDASASALGVVAAHVRHNGRDHAIYALRTPGGLVLSNPAMGLFTIGYNLFQSDARIIAAVNVDLAWGDGVIHQERDPEEPYDPATAGWDIAGTVKIRVTRTGAELVIETTQFDGELYAGGKRATITLGGPGTEMFLKPSNWGVVSYAQQGGRFKVTNRPDKFVPYVVCTYGEDGVDTFQIHEHNGTGWVSKVLDAGNDTIRPGRIYYSDINGRMYFARRNGSLKPLYIEQFTREPNTAFSP